MGLSFLPPPNSLQHCNIPTPLCSNLLILRDGSTPPKSTNDQWWIKRVAQQAPPSISAPKGDRREIFWHVKGILLKFFFAKVSHLIFHHLVDCSLDVEKSLAIFPTNTAAMWPMVESFLLKSCQNSAKNIYIL